MTTLKEIKLHCPVCTRDFTDQAVLSTNSFGGKRTDFHERAAGKQPLPYYVHTCPRCGYSGGEHGFSDDVEVASSVAEHIQYELMPRVEQEMPLSGSEKYEMASKVASWRGADSREVADLLLRAAWCCVDEGDIEAERYFRRRAALAFADALAEYDVVAKDERAVLTYLVGELWRRVGDMGRSHEWFGKVAGEIMDPVAGKWIIDATRRQDSAHPREWFG